MRSISDRICGMTDRQMTIYGWVAWPIAIAMWFFALNMVANQLWADPAVLASVDEFAEAESEMLLVLGSEPAMGTNDVARAYKISPPTPEDMAQRRAWMADGARKANGWLVEAGKAYTMTYEPITTNAPGATVYLPTGTLVIWDNGAAWDGRAEWRETGKRKEVTHGR